LWPSGRAWLSGTGSYLPPSVVFSEELERNLGLPPGWIAERTGISSRHLASSEEATSDLAFEAGRRALENAGLSPREVDMVLLATSTPDHPLPPTAPYLAWRLGCRPGVPALDLAAACSGFVYALSVGEKFVRSGEARHLLLIGANVMSRRVDWSDPDTASLFADGAGAVVLSPSPDPRRGVLSSLLASWGEGASLLWVPSGGSRTPLTAEGLKRKEDRIRMTGPALARRAVRMMEEVLGELLRREGMKLRDVDWLLPHQANGRILESLARRLGFPRERMIVNVGEVGNTSAASIPIALDQARSAGRIREGEVMALLAFGGGLTAGAALLRW